MTSDEAAETLIYECETLFEAAEKEPADWPALLARIREMIAAAEQAQICPRLVIWRLRRRLAALCERFAQGRAPNPERRRFKHG
jgi:hypothetical protein